LPDDFRSDASKRGDLSRIEMQVGHDVARAHWFKARALKRTQI
jgi:hypothetical protein